MKLKDRNIGRVKTNLVLIKWAAYTKVLAVKLASYLEARSERLSLSAKRVWLIGFCTVGISCSLGVIAYSFVTIEPAVKNHTIKVPIHFLNLSHTSSVNDSIITALQYQRIQQFEQYLKRKQQNNSGRLFYDSLLIARPHLLDSLRLIDSLFSSQ